MSGAPIELAPGRHELVCRQAGTGAELRKQVLIRVGQVTRVTDPLPACRVRLRLQRGDAVRISGREVRRSDFTLAPKRYDLELLRGGQALELLHDGQPVKRVWVDFPSGSCTLIDTPYLRCQ